jgi:hypothetical protein
MEKRKVNEYLLLLPTIPATDQARKKRVLAHINRWVYNNASSKTHYPQLALTKLTHTHSELDAQITGEAGPVCMFVGLVSHAPFDEFESVEEAVVAERPGVTSHPPPNAFGTYANPYWR